MMAARRLSWEDARHSSSHFWSFSVMSRRSIARYTYTIRLTLKGWTVALNGREVLRTWSRAAAEEATMDAALCNERAGRPVAVVVQSFGGRARTIARGQPAPRAAAERSAA
jgi:hypothetical protein